MGFDILALAAVRHELEPRVVGGQVQKLSFPGPLSLGLGIFRTGAGRTDVLLTAEGDAARAHAVAALPPRGEQPDSPLSLLARKHVRDARVSAIVQPPWERVLVWELEQHARDGSPYQLQLVVESMGRRGNLVLVSQDGTILDAARRSPPRRNPRRPVLPHQPYQPPPPLTDRLPPDRLSAADLRERARGHGGSLAEFLRTTLAGASPLMAREIAFRATMASDSPLLGAPWDRVVEQAFMLVAPLESGAWQPTLAFHPDFAEPLDYAAFEPTHLAAGGLRLESAPSMSAAIEQFHLLRAGEAATSSSVAVGDQWRSERAALHAILDRREAGAVRRIAALERQLAGTDQAEGLRHAGELLLSYQWQIEAGAGAVELEGQAILLDGQLSVVENANSYFARYRKVRDAARHVPDLLATEQGALLQLRELAALVDVADSPEGFRALRREAAALGGRDPAPRERGSPARTREKASGPYRTIPLDDQWRAYIGASAAGNVAVTFQRARPEDIWLHARGVPGAHVVLAGPGGVEPPAAILQRAAELAAWYSGNRANGQVEVDYTPCRFVKKISGGFPGQVTYSGERAARVAPRPPAVSGEPTGASGIMHTKSTATTRHGAATR